MAPTPTWTPTGQKPRFGDLRKRVREDGIEVVSIVYRSEVSPDGNVIRYFALDSRTVNSVDGVQSAIASLEGLREHHYVSFPVYDEASGVSLPTDGTTHEIELRIGNRHTTFPLTLGYRMSSGWPIRFILVAGALGALLASIAWAAYMRGARQAGL